MFYGICNIIYYLLFKIELINIYQRAPPENISINWKIKMIEQIKTPQFPNHIDEQNSPHEYFCPISRELMHEPVITMDGYSFQREVIEKWFKQKDKSPITGLKIEKKVIQNRALKQAIKYHNERQSKAYLNAQKLIETTNTYIKDTIPQLINDIGMLDLDKLITISIENIELKRTLNEIAAQNSKLERRMQSKNNLCQGCSRNISNIIKRAENVIQTSPTINTMNVSAKEFQYLPLSVNQLKRIDFCQLRKENWKLKMFKSYGIQKCSLEILIKRIKNLNKIPENSYTQIWRTSLPINQFYDKIKKELSYQKCTYTRKLLQIGPRIMNTKIQLDELDLKQGQYLVIEHGINNSQQLFRGETVRCQYCYDFKPQKFQCSCETSSYCSQKCAERDLQFHVKQCKLGVNAKLISC